MLIIEEEKRQTVWTSVLWRMTLSTNRHLRVGSMLKTRYSKPNLNFTKLFKASSVAIKNKITTR